MSADEKAKRIYVVVSGKQKRDYFAVIRKVITDINMSFEKLLVTELVPLPDAPEVLLDYRELLGHELAERDEIFVGRRAKAYKVQALLNGIEEKSVRLTQHVQTVINVQGDYFGQSTVGVVNSTTSEGEGVSYRPQTWEKVVTYAAGLLSLATILYLLIRNQPIADPNFAVLVRIVLSLIAAVFGATLPGTLGIDIQRKGLAIRAAGALALFIVTFMLTPKIFLSP